MDRQTIGIIGFGRFGQFWAGLLKDDYTVLIADKEDRTRQAEQLEVTVTDLKTLCARAGAIFLCVPIRHIRETILDLKPQLRPGTVVLDTCSVKVFPSEVMKQELMTVPGIDLIATHPMFGPDSGQLSIRGLPIVMWPLLPETAAYRAWRDYFVDRGLRIVEIPPDEHDRFAANSQGITHYIGRILDEMHLQRTPIDTKGFEILRQVLDQTTNDSWELFHDLQNYNPFTREMRLRLEGSMDKIYDMLMPIESGRTRIGIQGGQGSFNEEACRHYCSAHDITDYDIEYLYTAVNVLNALHRGEVDRGVFAIQNARGGVVMETIQGLSRFKCEILDVFEIVISHCIMHHPSVRFEDVDTVISHPQALAQCQDTLARKYPHLKQINGEGNLIDQALCAQYISEGKLPDHYAVLAAGVCADLYGLTVHDVGLQDMGAKNLTTFVWVQRRNYFR